MKFTIELSIAEVKGIKDYLASLDNVPTDKKYLTAWIENIVCGTIHSPREAVSDFINKHEKILAER